MPEDKRKHPVKNGRGEWVFLDIKTPFDGAEVSMNNWWHMKDGKGVFFKATPKTRPSAYSPQCNCNEAIVRRMNEKEAWADFDVEFVEVAYLPPREYC